MATKSFTIKIGADSRDFNKGLKEADKQINNTAKAGKALQKSLEYQWDSKKFVHAQQLAQEAIDLTDIKIKTLRDQLKYLEETGGVNTDNYYDLQVKLANAELKAKDLADNLEKLDRLRIDNIKRNVQELGSHINAVAKSFTAISVANAGVLTGIYKMTNSAITQADTIATVAQQYGVASEEIQRWNYVALQSDVSSDHLYKGMRKVRQAVSEINEGKISSVSEAIAQLLEGGEISADTSKGFEQIVTALMKIEDATKRSYFMNQIFGTELANNLIPLIDSGADSMNELSQEFYQLGYMSNEQVDELSKFDTEFKRLKTEFSNLSYQFASVFIPIVERFVSFLENKVYPILKRVATWFSELDSGTQNLIISASAMLAILTPTLMLVSKIVSSVGGLIGLLPTLSSMLTALSANPIIAIISAVVGLMGMLYLRNEEFRNSVNNLVKVLASAFTPILKYMFNLLSDIFKLLEPLIDLLSNYLIFALDTVARILEKIVGAIKSAVDFIDKVADKVGRFFGKGVLWGIEDIASSKDNILQKTTLDDNFGNQILNNNTSSIDTSTVINNININAEGASADEIYNLIAKKLAVKIQSRG